jgi:putative Holliday junction resolvase
VSSKKQINTSEPHREAQNDLAGRLLALDPGEKRVGVGISDEMHLTVRPLRALRYTNWKKLLLEVKELLREFDAKALVIGLPLSLDGIERSSAKGVAELKRKFALSLDVPIFLQDERLTSHEAEESLRAAGHGTDSVRQLLDSESAAIILRDFIEDLANRLEVKP